MQRSLVMKRHDTVCLRVSPFTQMTVKFVCGDDIVCYWFDTEFKQAVFHSSELEPVFVNVGIGFLSNDDDEDLFLG